jgi:hypothetical protein
VQRHSSSIDSAVAHATGIIERTCQLAGKLTFVSDLRADLRRAGLLAAIQCHDTAAVFDWLIGILSYQGIANRVAEGFLLEHGNVRYSDIESALRRNPSCSKLSGHWHFNDCGYQKSSQSCSEPLHFPTCPLPDHHVWIICEQTPAAGARSYVEAYRHVQLMSAIECEQAIVDFRPLLTFLASNFKEDPISKCYIPPTFYDKDGNKADLHSKITLWLNDPAATPIAIWAGYGMGKTSYARFLASILAENCSREYGSPIPILLNLGEFTTAPDIETLIVAQLANHYGVRFVSSAAFRLLNTQGRFVLILDGFDEMKFAMAPNDFNFISAQIRKAASVNPKLLLLGRPDSIESGEEQQRLTSSRITVHNTPLRVDEGPDFDSVRLASLSKEEYLTLIRNFLTSTTDPSKQVRPIDATLNLGDILERPVQAKMLAEVVADPQADIRAISRFTLYDLFIKRILRREEEKAVRRNLGSAERTHFMRLLAWWLWTIKRTRTFAANEIPLEIIQKFQIPGVPLEGLRRELLIGSIIEEKNIGYFLAEKDAGVFYFPHTSFTEFLVADYIMSADFLSIDVPKLPDALYGEVPTFLKEHPIPDAIFAVYKRMKAAQIAMSTSCLTVLLNDIATRIHIELVKPTSADPWDICLHYFFLHASNASSEARKFLFACLESAHVQTELAAMYCLMYEDALSAPGSDSAMARMIFNVFRRIGLADLHSAAIRGDITAYSSEVNHFAEVITSCIRFARSTDVMFDSAEFSTVALSVIGNSCAVTDVIERIPTTFRIPGNNLLAVAADADERTLIADLLRHEGSVKVIPVMTAATR